MESARLHLLRFDHEISALQSQKLANQSELEKLSHLRAKIGTEIEKISNEIASIEKDLKETLKRNEWISDSQKYKSGKV